MLSATEGAAAGAYNYALESTAKGAYKGSFGVLPTTRVPESKPQRHPARVESDPLLVLVPHITST